MSFSICYYHLIWTTRGREPVIGRPHIGIILDAIDEHAEKMKTKLMAISVLADHVHIAVSIPPHVRVEDWVRAAKHASAEALRRDGKDMADFAWQRGYGAMTFSAQTRGKTIAYVKRQPALHAENATHEYWERTED
jgi:REP element-mobilizing transposase RayT